MKKILYLFTLILFVLASCDPMEEIYNELDAMDTGYSNSVEYTLTEDDYVAIADMTTNADAAEFIGDMMYFTDEFSASVYVPDYLVGLYPALSEGSSALITYKFNSDVPEDLLDYTNFDEYELETGNYYTGDDGDYVSANDVLQVVNYFSPGYAPEAYIPIALEDAIVDPVSGDMLVVEYMYSDVTPSVDFGELDDIPFWVGPLDDELGDFEVVSIDDSSSTWYQSGYGGTDYAKISAYNDGFNEDWLISPTVDLSAYSDVYLNFRHTAKYVSGRWDLLTVWVSDDYAGDVGTATWDEITGYTDPAGDDYVFVESGLIDLSAYAGGDITVAFKYMSEDGVAATWEIDKVELLTPLHPVVGTSPMTLKTVYEFVGDKWKVAKDVYMVTGPDYDAMGAPGNYNNFSGSDLPYDYIPALLKAKFPLSGEGAEKVVIYRYYTGVSGVYTITLADTYVFTGGAWMSTYKYVDDRTSQFLFSDGNWVFDPTVIFTMKSEDYLAVVNWVGANVDASYVDSYGTAEFYTGSGSYYSNYDKRIGKWDDTVFDTADEAIAWGIANALLPTKFPNAVAQVSGIDVFYIVHFAYYDGANGTQAMKFKCTKSGPSPEFTFVEMQ